MDSVTGASGHRLDRGCGGAIFYRSTPRVCPECGETFRYTRQWVYRRKDRIFCRYKCMMDYDKRQAAEDAAKQEVDA